MCVCGHGLFTQDHMVNFLQCVSSLIVQLALFCFNSSRHKYALTERMVRQTEEDSVVSFAFIVIAMKWKICFQTKAALFGLQKLKRAGLSLCLEMLITACD